ncbi:MAG: hypothetical protein V3U92_06475 [Cellulophaga sp.]
MKSNFKFLATLTFLGIFLQSCNSDDDTIDYDTDRNPERFENIEIGNADFKVPQFNTDLHTQFDYIGKRKVKKISFDISPISVEEPNTGEVKWQVTDYLLPEKYYLGKLNPHIHHHVYFDPENKNFPEVRPAQGIYSLKITVVEEDNSESYITKQFEIAKKFLGVEIGHDNEIKLGSDELHTEFQYDAGGNTVSEIKYQLWFEEWREGQNVAVGSWDNFVIVLPSNLYKNQSSPQIHYHMDMITDSPIGDYWLNIYVKETGESEAVKLSVPFSIVN